MQQGMKGILLPSLAPGWGILILLTIIFCPGMGMLIIFFRKCQNPHPMSDPPLGLDSDRCIIIRTFSVRFQRQWETDWFNNRVGFVLLFNTKAVIINSS